MSDASAPFDWPQKLVNATVVVFGGHLWLGYGDEESKALTLRCAVQALDQPIGDEFMVPVPGEPAMLPDGDWTRYDPALGEGQVVARGLFALVLLAMDHSGMHREEESRRETIISVVQRALEEILPT